MKELKSPINVDTPLGSGVAYFIAAGGFDGKELGCFRSLESWWWPNRQIRRKKSMTDYRYQQSPIQLTEEAEEPGRSVGRTRWKN